MPSFAGEQAVYIGMAVMDERRFAPVAGAMCLASLLFGAVEAAAQNLTVVSSASYGSAVAPESRATIFGSGLASETAIGQAGSNGKLPRELAGVAVEVDGRAAELAYVSPRQINFIVPRQVNAGEVRVAVSTGGATIATGSALISQTAPGVFTTDGSGSGAGLIFNAATFSGAPFPAQTAELPGCDKRTRLTVFASGIRNAVGADAIGVTLSDSTGVEYAAPVEHAGASKLYTGVDEVRFVVPDEVPSAELLQVRIEASGVESNSVTVMLEPADVVALDCSSYGAAFVYNSVADLLAGDLWDTARPATVFADLESTPGDWEIAGVGTTALDARNGEVIAAGVAGSPELVWSDPEFPPTVRTLTVEPVPFVGVGAGNPASVIVAQAQPGEPIHQQIIDLARERGLAFASIRVSGRFSPVSYSVAHKLLKQGTPLTDPAADKAPYQLFFTAEESAEWELSGFYAAGASLQDLVSVRGAPVHLHGFRLDRSRAGHIGSAIVENAEIRLYPLAAPIVHDADLTIRNLIVAGGQASFEAANDGDGIVTRATVQGLVGDRVVFQTGAVGLGRPRPPRHHDRSPFGRFVRKSRSGHRSLQRCARERRIEQRSSLARCDSRLRLTAPGPWSASAPAPDCTRRR